MINRQLANYRIVSVIIAIITMFSALPLGNLIATNAYAAPMGASTTGIGASITGIAAKPLELENQSLDIENLSINAESYSVGFSLGLSNFTWSDTPDSTLNSLTGEVLFDNGITAVVTKIQGENITCTPVFENYHTDKVQLSLQFNSDIPGWETQNFEFTAALAQNGIEKTETRVFLKGVAYRQDRIIHVGSRDEHVWLGASECIIPDENVSQIEVEFAGSDDNGGVSLSASMLTGQKYYGTATVMPISVARYPQVTHVAILDVTDNFKNGVVRFYDFGSTYQVYNGDTQAYLGQNGTPLQPPIPPFSNGFSANAFPYTDSYYLAVGKLDEPMPQKHSVTYHPNGATGGIVPVDTNKYYPGEKVSILFPNDFYEVWENEYLRRDGYIFDGWNTKPDGTGEQYDEPYWLLPSFNGTFFIKNEDVTLYAQWVSELALEIKDIEPRSLISMDNLSLEKLALSAGAVIRLKLDESNFVWRNQPLPLSEDLLRLNKIDVVRRVLKGSRAINSLAIEEDENGDVYVAVHFRNDSGSNSSTVIDFNIEIYLEKNRKRQRDSKTILAGSISLPAASYTSNGTDSSRSSGSGTRDTSISTNSPAIFTTAAATQAVIRAISEAKASDKTTANVTIRNISDVSLDTFDAMIKTAGSMPLKFNADSTNGNSVDVRITVDPSKATKNVNLSASKISSHSVNTESFFERWFNNNVSVISLSQQGDFGMSVEIAAKVDPVLDTKALHFYSYDAKSNTCKQIPEPNYWIDKNGYVHFTVTLAGDIIITDKPFTKKSPAI